MNNFIICGVYELEQYKDVDYLISISDPKEYQEQEYIKKFVYNNKLKDRVFLRFVDTCTASEDGAPHSRDIAALKGFLDKHKDNLFKKKTLIHCHAGISRSTAAAYCALCYLGITPYEAIRMVATNRWCAWPNLLVCKLWSEYFKNPEVHEIVSSFMTTTKHYISDFGFRAEELNRFLFTKNEKFSNMEVFEWHLKNYNKTK